ncbi:restriction endonuclease subunit S [Microbispora sp. H10836]|uniref:restriction endonuclease subunit S n=1 Tax=Microbispora sp. H10836 TaxID=2729106 RepID=UPI0020169A14|nr:restriction endonuclease subunit S [Microbispora sp. H10836]
MRTKRHEAIALLEDLAQSIFLEMFTTPGGASSPWKIRGIEDVCSLIVDCVNRTAPTVDYVTPYKMIRTTNVKNGKVNLSEVRYVERETFERWNRRTTPLPGDVILTREAPVGEVGIIKTDDQVFLGQRLMLYRVDPKYATPEYLLAAFRSPFVQKQLDRSSSGSTVKHLPLPACRSIQVPSPPISLQLEFTARVKAIDSLKLGHVHQLQKLDALFGSLQQRAFQGDLWDNRDN